MHIRRECQAADYILDYTEKLHTVYVHLYNPMI